MNKSITLTLTDAEYRELILLFHLGHLVKDSITEKSRAEMMQEIEFMQKLSRQGKESGSKHVFTADKYKQEDLEDLRRQLELLHPLADTASAKPCR